MSSSIQVNLEYCSSGPHRSATESPEKLGQMRDQRLAMSQQSGTDSFTDRYLSGRASSYDHTATMRQTLADLTPRLPSNATNGSSASNGNSN
ncbi:uncharacterized protein F4812DRAFT_440647 [Daldinia caldariorum]|uniref:uncharacterized protein n=1 Tax=Daldinia caldariorum TaxID=326644 RepID=UPI002007677A|nr:uncharacterized protein F4812DRAFT_440647 [Daldinia caldariorum]KAI1464842.1 hypothetical protein F4812DRAFT_440647 [Daldinia caldariorum]